MKPVNEIYAEFLLGNVRFHCVMEHDLFRDSLMFHMDGKYSTSAVLCAVLYERVFTTRLIRETANPSGFVPSKENIQEQLQNLIDREHEIVNVKKLTFREITSQLVDANVISPEEKNGYDKFYSEIRNPVAHGITVRLFEPLLSRKPANAFEIDISYSLIYEKASAILIDKLHHLMAVKVLRKQ